MKWYVIAIIYIYVGLRVHEYIEKKRRRKIREKDGFEDF